MLLTVRLPEAGMLDPALSRQLAAAAPGEEFAVLVKLKKTAGEAAVHTPRRQRAVLLRELRNRAELSQRDIVAALAQKKQSGRAGQVKPFWIFNGIAVSATADTIRELAARPDVAAVVPDRIVTLAAALPATPVSAADTWNLTRIGAPVLWRMGFTGRNVVVANLDTGVDIGHEALGSKWRGGSNSWFDPYNGTTVPYDLSGHGTATMGLMVGGNTGDAPVGVAPDAQWIAAKIFDDADPPHTTLSIIHQAFQWLLDPDQNPDTDDSPAVVNNSWDLDNPGLYDAEFAADIQNLTDAGINVVCVSGNVLLPQPAGTSTSPGNNPGAFPVGATGKDDQVAPFSARGPSAYDGSFYPALVAPGMAVRSTDLYNTYVSFSGTSFAAPHVAGAMALLRSALPGAGAHDIETALKEAVVTAAGPDNSSGYGRLDVAKAYSYLALPGDVTGDGVIDFVDVMVALRTITGNDAGNPLITKNANLFPLGPDGTPLGHDGPITIQDALLILQRAAGFISW